MSDTFCADPINDGVDQSIVDQLKAFGLSTLALTYLNEHFSCHINNKGNLTYIAGDGSEFTALYHGPNMCPDFGQSIELWKTATMQIATLSPIRPRSKTISSSGNLVSPRDLCPDS